MNRDIRDITFKLHIVSCVLSVITVILLLSKYF